MLTPQQAADAEQAMSMVRDLFPAHWRGLYRGMLEQGFDESQALELLKVYVIASCGPSRPGG